MSDPERGDEPGATAAAEPAPEDPLAALTRERDDLRDQILRRRAEFENYRRRAERERTVAQQEAQAIVFRAFLPALDNLDRALSVRADEGSLREGVELIRRDLLAVLESHGVAVEDPQGQRFDPERHQALAHESVAGFAEGTVVEVFRKGYLLQDKLLRPALVKVAKGVEDEPTECPLDDKGPAAGGSAS